MTRWRRRIGCAIAGLALGLGLGGVAGAAPCDSPAHRGFDFWLGTWQVHSADGKLAGHNPIEAGDDGCVLHERYVGARGGYRGESLNSYDAARRVWHQTWVDNRGLLLVLEGGLQDGAMVLEGQGIGADGAALRHRIRWTPSSDGSVRQHWETARDGQPWTTAFDGRYTRR